MNLQDDIRHMNNLRRVGDPPLDEFTPAQERAIAAQEREEDEIRDDPKLLDEAIAEYVNQFGHSEREARYRLAVHEAAVNLDARPLSSVADDAIEWYAEKLLDDAAKRAEEV